MVQVFSISHSLRKVSLDCCGQHRAFQIQTLCPRTSSTQCRWPARRAKRACRRVIAYPELNEAFEIAGIVSVGTNILGLAAGVGIVTSLAWSTLPVLSAPKEASAGRSLGEEDAGGIKWGVMSVLSFLPLFNWLASPSHDRHG